MPAISSKPSLQDAGDDAAPVSLGSLELQTAAYDAECVKLEDLVAALESDLEKVKRQHIVTLKRQAGVVANREAELSSSIERAGGLFIRPRTLTINGIKIGFISSVGSIVWDDDAQVVALIKRLRPEEAATLIRTTEVPNKNALKSFDAAELKKIGCHIEGAGDQVVLKRVAGDVEKLVNNLIAKLVAAITAEEKKA